MKDTDDINDIDDWIDAISDEDFGTIGTACNILKFTNHNFCSTYQSMNPLIYPNQDMK